MGTKSQKFCLETFQMQGDSYQNKLDTVTKKTKQFSNPQTLSSTFAVFRVLQPWAFGLLNRLILLDLTSN